MIENKSIPYILIFLIACLLIAFMLIENRRAPSPASVQDSPVVESNPIAESTRAKETDQALPQVKPNKVKVESESTKPITEQITSVHPDPVSVTLTLPSNPAEQYAPHVFDYLSPDQEISLINPETQEALPATVESVSDLINGETTIITGQLHLPDNQSTHFTIVNDPEVSTLTLRLGANAEYQVRVNNKSGKQTRVKKRGKGKRPRKSPDPEAEPDVIEEDAEKQEASETLTKEEVQRFIPSPSSSRESFRNIRD